MAGHTEGPWKALEVEPAAGLVCWWVQTETEQVATVGKEGDARRIAAAPDLLAACKAYVSRRSLDEADAAYRQMEDAIARAEGARMSQGPEVHGLFRSGMRNPGPGAGPLTADQPAVLKVRVGKRERHYLQQLLALGLHGDSLEEVARQLVMAGLRQALRDGLIASVSQEIGIDEEKQRTARRD